LVKEHGSFNLVYGAQRACFKVYVHEAQKGSNPNTIHLIPVHAIKACRGSEVAAAFINPGSTRWK